MKLLIANWKMAPDTEAQAQALAKASAKLVRTYKKSTHIIVCPPVIYIPLVTKVSTVLAVGGQSVSAESTGAHTGEISAAMLKSMHVTYCIVGHSETRAQGESNELVKKKITLLLEKKIQPIVCIGEQSRDVHGWYLSTIKDQVESVFFDMPKVAVKRIVLAYEPIWAIGAQATRTATVEECLEMIMYIRKLISDLYDEKTARSMAILYGGSVDQTNAASFIREGGVEGLLVGRVSLESKRLEMLVKAISE